MEVTETLHCSTCHQTFSATNKNNYKSQTCREGLTTAAQFFGWRWNQYLDNDDATSDSGLDANSDLQLEGLDITADVDSPTLSNPGVYIAQHPYGTAGIQDIVKTFSLNELPGSIQ